MTPTRPRALVVDDATTVRAYHRGILEDAGLEVEEASDGLEALERAMTAAVPPSLIVLDVNMPRLDGYAMLRALREAPSLAGVPAILVTTEAERRDAGRGFASGANLFLVKPVRPDRLAGLARVLAGLPA